MFGYVYITENLVNGKKYIGKHRASNTDDDQYLGSGTNLRRAIKKYGRQNFDKKIIAIANSKEELNLLEVATIAEHDAVRSILFYNLKAGGEGGDWRTAEQLIELSEKMCRHWREMTPENRAKIGELISKTRIGKSKLEHRAKISLAKLNISTWTAETAAKYSRKRQEEVANGIRVPPLGNRGNKDFRHDETSRHRIKISVRKARERVALERETYVTAEGLTRMREKATLRYTPEVRRDHGLATKEGIARRQTRYKEQGTEPPKFRWFHNPVNPKQRAYLSGDEPVPRNWVAGKGKTGARTVDHEKVIERVNYRDPKEVAASKP